MNRYLLIFLLLGITLPGMAQLKNAQQEIGLAFSNLDNFGITYKTGTKASMWRINTVLLSGNKLKEISGDEELIHKNIGFNVQFGQELRKEIVEHLEIRYGADLAFGINHSKNDRENNSDSDDISVSFTSEPTIGQVSIWCSG